MNMEINLRKFGQMLLFNIKSLIQNSLFVDCYVVNSVMTNYPTQFPPL